MEQKYYLAIDIGASSGRHIVGWIEGEKLQTKEVYRFPNGVVEENGHLTWDIRMLFSNVVRGILEAFKQFQHIESLSIDTWGVDYVLLKGDEEVYPVYSYRDSRTEAVIPQVREKVPFSELYAHTGCQFQPFNTVYQLYDEKINGRLDGVTDMLMIPEYLMWKLCGVKAREYTNATTMGMVNAETGEFDLEIVERLAVLIFVTLGCTVNDVGAYFVGRAVGTHKLAPIISPGKTVEGGLGGMVSSVILMSLIASLYSQCAGVEIRYGWLFLYLFLASIIGQFGDLAMSTIKRTVGIKDFSRVLPGHGGILDRFDSFLFAAPFAVLYGNMTGCFL